MILFDAARVLIPFIATFAAGIVLAPVLTHYLYKHKVWKKKGGKGKGLGDDTGTPLFDAMHGAQEMKTPRMGGILIWGSVVVVAALLAGVGALYPSFADLDFVNRGQTWLPLFGLLFGAGLGFINDVLDVTTPDARGLSLPIRLGAIALAAAAAGWWFYDKLDISAVGIPFVGPLELGILFIPFFVFVTLAIYASGVIDGIDGLSGGVFAIIFMAYAGIAFAQEQVALAAFAAAVSGGIFAFLWYNVPPARFWMTETGSMALTLALVLVAFSADVLGGGVGVAVLPIIALPLAATVISVALQVFWKKFFKRKLFKMAPLHHHFEAIGWPSYKVTMRYWIITIMAGVFGIAIALLK